jgi:hypothetical protein
MKRQMPFHQRHGVSVVEAAAGLETAREKRQKA